MATPRGSFSASPPLAKSRRNAERTPRRPTPLALALQAQWSLLQQHLQLNTIPRTAERDLLTVLESLPENQSAILSDVEGVLPYILAFAVAPIPSERTQVIALGAMQAIIGSLTTIWGKKATAVLVREFLTREHNALHALGVAISVALDDGAGEVEEMSDGLAKKKGKRLKQRRSVMLTESRISIIGRALELLLMVLTLSASIAAAALTHPKLIHAIVRCLPVVTPTQVSDVASILLSLSAGKGAAEVLVAYRVYHSVLHYIRTSVRGGGVGTSPPANVTMTALCLFLRFVVRLSGDTTAFVVLQEDPTIPHVLEELLHSEWGEVVQSTCDWFLVIMEQHTKECVGFVEDILLRTRVGEQLSNILLLRPLTKVPFALSAARCWRWFSLVNPNVMGCFLVSNPNTLFSLVQTLTTPSPSYTHQQQQQQQQRISLRTERELDGQEEENNCLRELLTEVACALGICYGLSKRETRAAVHRLIFHRFLPLTQEEVQRRLVSIFESIDDGYFDQYPKVMAPRRTNHNSIRLSLSEKNPLEYTTETDDDDDEDDNVERNVTAKGRKVNSSSSGGGGSGGVRPLCSREQWRSFVLRSLIRMFRTNAPTKANGSSFLQGHCARDAAALRRTSKVYNNNINSNNRAVHVPLDQFMPAGIMRPSSLQFGVVQRAEQMGGVFYLDTIRVILRLAHHYKHKTAKDDSCSAAKWRSMSMYSSGRVNKAPNPWAPPVKVESSRRWSVEEVQRSDAILFCVSYDNIVVEMSEALVAVEEHTRNLGQCLRVCPTKALQRRCLLNDLYMHVYPKIHMFLRFIQHHMARSRVVLQIIAENERAVHSGNILDLYEAIGHCVGGEGVPAVGEATTHSQ